MIGQFGNRGRLSLVLALSCACGLLVAPAASTEAIRSAVRDAIGPGEQALAAARRQGRFVAERLAAYLPHWKPATAAYDAPTAVAETDRSAAAERARRLELQVAALHERLAEGAAAAARRLSVETSEPLLGTKCLPARVIGANRSAVVQLAERLIDAGTVDGLAPSDLVVQASYSSDESGATDPVIDQGTDQSLTPDLPVAAGGVLVGRIRRAGRLTSTVQLARDAGFRIAARLMRDTPEGPVFGAAGLFAGGGDAACRLELIDASAPVMVGDRVYTHEPLAGETVSLLIGTIASAELPPGATQWRITVVPACDEVPTQVEVLRIELNPQRLSP